MEEDQVQPQQQSGFVDIPITKEGSFTPLALQEDIEQEKLGWLESLKVGGTDTWLTSIASDSMSRQTFSDDPEFKWTGAMVEQYTQNLSDSYLDFVMDSKSEQEAQYRFGYAQERQELETKLTNSGWGKGLAAGVVAALDPVEIGAVTVATYGLGTIPRTLAKLGKAVDKAVDTAEVASDLKRAEQIRKATNVRRSAGLGFVEGVATVAPFEYLKTEYLPQWNDDDLALVLAVAGGLGSTIRGSMTYFDKMKLVATYHRRTSEGKPPLTDAERELFKDVIEDDSLQTTLKRLEDIDNAMKVGDDGLQKDAFDATVTYENAPKQLGTNFGVFGLRKVLSTVARAMDSSDGRIRELGQRLGLNSAGNTDRTAVNFGAIEQQNWFINTSTARFLPNYQKLRKTWLERNYPNMKMGEMADKVLEFNQNVSMAVRGVSGLGDEVDAAADLWRAEAKYFVGEAKASKMRGTAELEHADDYVPRIIEDNRWDAMRLKIGDEGLIELLKEAIRRAQPDIADDLLQTISEGYVNGVNKRIQMNLFERSQTRLMGLYEDTLEDIRLGLIERYGDDGVDDIMAQIEEALPNSVKAKSKGIPRTRQRVELDEMASITMPDGTVVRFTDILNNDIENLHQMYTYQMGGGISLARNGIEREGMESFDSILDRLQGEVATNADDAAAKAKEIEALRFMYDGVTGRLAHSSQVSEGVERNLRRIREFNFIRIMGASGIPTMVEAAAVVFEHSAKTLFQGIPRLRNMIAKAKTGDLEDPLMREMMHLTGEGIDMFTGRVRTYFDDMETDLVRSDYTKLDYYLAKGRNFVATGSGMLPLTAMFRRADTMFYAYDWFNAAMRKGNKSPFKAIKMEQLGISPEDGNLILEQIRKHAVKDKKGKLVHMNTDAWDERAKRLFALSAKRHSSQSVQETNISSVNRFMRSPIGKTAFQFLSYVTAAQEQQFQRHAARLRHGDILQSGTTLMAGSFMATMAYVAGVHYRSTGMSDDARRKYLNDRLTTDRLFLDGAIGYLGALSFHSTFFQQLRESNLIQNPTFQTAQQLQQGIGGLYDAAVNDKDMSEKQIKRLFGLVSTNLYPVGMATNYLASELAD